MASKIKGLQQWCSRRTEGYKDVNVTDMSSSWRDGLAFCAIIHRFRPDLIDFDSLSKENILENNQLAYEVAEEELDIPAFLDAPDMVRMKKPDKLSIITYVSQYYNYFHDKPELGGPGVRKAGARSYKSIKTGDDNSKKTTFKEQNGVASNKSKTGTMGDKCTICDGKVYLLERHVENNKLYHRLCFRHSAMSPTNKAYKAGSKNEDNTSASKVRKLDHKADSDSMFGRNSGKKSLFPEEKNNGVSLLSYSSSNASQVASKTPSKYHQHAMEFLARDDSNENSSFSDKTKSFTTSTPKSKYEDKTSLTVVSSTSQNGVRTTYGDSPAMWSSDKDNVQLTKFSLQADKNKVPERKSSDVIETRAREMRKLLEEKSRDQKVESPKSGLRDFLKKYHDPGEKEKENKSTSKTLEKMEVDTSSPHMHKKEVHNASATNKMEEKTLKPWESHERRANDSKITFTPIKANDNKLGVTDYKSVLNKSKPDVSVNSVSEERKVSRNPATSSALSSYKSNLDKLKDKDTSVDKVKKDNEQANGTSYSFCSKSSDDRKVAKSEGFTSCLKPNALTDKDSGRKSPLYTKKSDSKSKENFSSKYIKDSNLDSKKADNKVNSDFKLDSTKSNIKLNSSKDTDLSSNSRFYKGSSDKKESEKKVVSPVPKPRGILKPARHEEDMDVSEKQSIKTSISLTPSAAPRSVQKISKLNNDVSKTPRSKSPIRPKSPVLSNVRFSSTVKEASEAPPPLPVSPPPRVSVASSSTATSQPKTSSYSSSKFPETAPPLPRKSYKDQDECSPPLPPRNTLKVVSQDTHVIGQAGGPPKPPRLTWRQESQMSVDEALHKAMNPDTSPEPVAVLVSPSDSSSSNILGGLLKSLAGVRQNSPTEKSPRNNIQYPKSDNPLNSKDKEAEVTLRRGGKDFNPNTSAPVLNLANRSNKDRPKSVSSVLDNYNNNKYQDDDTPSWRTHGDKPENDRNTRRPKSVAILDDDGPSVKWKLDEKKNEKPRPKSTLDNSSDGMLTWQRDAAKRMAKNKVFVDPEFEKKTGKKVPEERKSNLNHMDWRKTEKYDAPDTPSSPVGLRKVVDEPDNRQAPVRPPRVRLSPSPPNDNSTHNLVDRKNETNKYNGLSNLSQPVLPSSPHLRKITPNIKFDFDKSSEFENSMDLSNKNLRFDGKLTTPKPPPLKVDISPRRYSPGEIRTNLVDIDNKLTELELRGRQLEDTIRNATTSEGEDELMNEWFKLINEKNELVRQEADLIYITKEQELEDEQESIDSRLRYLMSMPENDKTQDERDEEEELLDKKLDIINKRSTIVDSMDEDRLRYEEEDREISNVLQAKGFEISNSVQKRNGGISQKKKK